MNLLDVLFPKSCYGCGKIGEYLCQRCQSDLLQTYLVCPECEKPSIGGLTHPLCHKKYGLDGLWSLGIYQGPLRKIIQSLKYRFAYDLDKTLVNLIVDYWAKNSPLLIEEIKKQGAGEWIVTPVPLYKSRQNWRGFNQSGIVGKLFAERIGLKYREVLTRIKSTKQQVGLSAWQRKQNIRRAFSLTSSYQLLTNNCILVDDVWTTGSTIKECCYVLKKAGAKKIWALTIAR